VAAKGKPDPVALLRADFPDFFAGAEFDIDDDGPYQTYGAFADHLLRRRTDQTLWARAIAFINDTARNHPSLHDLLGVALLEPLGEDTDMIAVLQANLNPAARTLI